MLYEKWLLQLQAQTPVIVLAYIISNSDHLILNDFLTFDIIVKYVVQFISLPIKWRCY